MDTLTASKIIDALGGTNETAKLCKVSAPSVSDWRKNGIPPARLMFLRLARRDLNWAELDPDGSAEVSLPNPTDEDRRQADRRALDDRRAVERRAAERRAQEQGAA